MPVLVGGKPPKKPFNIKGERFALVVCLPLAIVLFLVRTGMEKGSKPAPQPSVAQTQTAPSPVTSAPQPAPQSGDKTARGLAVTDRNQVYEQTYKLLLDTVEPRCNESRETIGDMVYKSVQIARERGLSTSNLDMLNGLNSATEPLDEAKTSTKCADILAAMILIMESKSK